MQAKRSRRTVDNFGLHHDKEDGVTWLLQQSGGTNAIGLPNSDCPYRIKTPLMLCPHDFDLSVQVPGNFKDSWEKLVPHCEIASFFDPKKIPEVKTLYLSCPNMQAFQAILNYQQIMSPAVTCSVGASVLKDLDKLIKRLESSDLAMYVVWGVNVTHTQLVERLILATMGTKGRLVLAGDNLPLYNLQGSVKRMNFTAEAAHYISGWSQTDLRALGAQRLKERMRGV